MKKRILFILLFLLPIVSFSQLTEKNKEILREELAEKINHLRISKGLKPLRFNDTLKKAAEFHSEYMAKNNLLSHDEKRSKYATPKKRVAQFQGDDFERIGENVLYSTPQPFPLRKKDLIKLADEMFTSWKNSPGHYANMTEVEYTFGDFGFKENAKNNTVFATEVFGTKGYIIDNQLSKNDFGLIKAPDDCEKSYKDYTNLVLNLGNDLKIVNNEVILYYQDLKLFKKIFTSPNDGIAIDLISKNQLKCDSPNKLDFSPIYDGIMLKPFFTPEMLSANRAEGEYRLITKVGDIPNELATKEFSPSMILIKNGKACKYVYPAFTPRKSHNLIPFEPLFTDEPSISLTKKGIIRTETVNYDFNVDETSAIKNPTLNNLNEEVSSIQISAYSSVEGDSIHNKQLQNLRANYIKNHLISTLCVSPHIFTLNAKENWEQMNFQLTYYKQDSLLNLSHNLIKKHLVNRADSLPWDSLLYSQRRATAVINYLGEYIDSATSYESFGEFNLRTAVASENALLANKALYEMYKSGYYDWAILFQPQIIEFIKKQPKVIGNYAALLSHHYSYDPYFVTDFIYTWVDRIDELDVNGRNNLIHLYTLVGTYLLDNWDVSSKNLSNVIHPFKIEKLSTSNTNAELVINLHLTFIEYFGQINDEKNISKSFNFISNYFENHTLKEEDDVSLALFYNNWSMYYLTVEHLLSKFKEGKINEDGLFILAETMNFTNLNAHSEAYLNVQKKALSSNQYRWCDWINNDFQVLRNYEVKKIYCESCR